ncbi:hypothetical protein [Paenibacillus kribbensis]|uniref:hypothetical protein n=1 Tax=Paenibacillus kribbensis TaxID=172713 RepID=UPI000837AA09|nr:hypothetical protein [Paenibacillus kribbensis]
MKKFKPMLLVMIAALLMFSFTTEASAASRIRVSKPENERLVNSERLYIDNEEVELDIGIIARGEASVYLLFEDAETEDTILMSQLMLTPAMTTDMSFTSHHKNPRPGYYYITIIGDYNSYVTARLKKAY